MTFFSKSIIRWHSFSAIDLAKNYEIIDLKIELLAKNMNITNDFRPF